MCLCLHLFVKRCAVLRVCYGGGWCWTRSSDFSLRLYERKNSIKLYNQIVSLKLCADELYFLLLLFALFNSAKIRIILLRNVSL